MVPYLFLTHSAALAEYWHKALGVDSVVVEPGLDAARQHVSPETLLWVDLAGLSPSERDADWPAVCHQCRVVIMSSTPDDGEGMHWLQQGAAGYAHAYSTTELLQQVAATVNAGSTWVGRSLLLRLCQRVGTLVPPPEVSHWREKVSVREAEVIEALKKGLSNKEIARDLDITERTVKAHLTAIFQKFAVEDRLQLLLKLTERTH